MGAHVDAEEAGAGDIVHVPLFIQCVIPCEPGLAAHPREYTKAFMAEWWVHGKADASARWHSISLKARADFLSLVGSDITVNWKRPK
jgi:hypothetical protein